MRIMHFLITEVATDGSRYENYSLHVKEIKLGIVQSSILLHPKYTIGQRNYELNLLIVL